MKKNVIHTIEKIIRKEMNDLTITNIKIDESTDFDGDTIFRITVVFDGKTGIPNADKMAGLVRHVRSQIENEVSYFPIFKFISQADARGIGIAAA